MTDIDSVVSTGTELLRDTVTNSTVSPLAKIFRLVTRNVPRSSLENLHRDIRGFSNPRVYENPTERYNIPNTRHSMHFLKQCLLNNTGTWIKNCELPVNTFQGIMESLLTNGYKDHLKEFYLQNYLPPVFEGFLRFAMNQSLNQAGTGDSENKFYQLQFSLEKMKAAKARAESKSDTDQEFRHLYTVIQTESVQRSPKAKKDIEYSQKISANAEDLAYALLAKVYPPENKAESKFINDEMSWTLDLERVVNGLNHIRYALQYVEAAKN